jgi:hypothetical protein
MGQRMVAAVGIDRVARQDALQLEIGEEVEHELLGYAPLLRWAALVAALPGCRACPNVQSTTNWC